MSIDVVEVVIWRESSVSGGSGAVQMFLRWQQRSEERFSRNAETDLVCRLLLEKKNMKFHTVNASNDAEIDAAFATLTELRAGALSTVTHAEYTEPRKKI